MLIARALLNQMLAFCRAKSGVAALEFGIISPVLIAVLLPLIDVGLGLYQEMEVENAAQAGAQYAMVHGWNSANIQSAITNATTLASVSAAPAPAKTCGCPGGTSVTAATCNSNCTDGQQARTYVTASAQAVYTPLVSYVGIGTSVTISRQSTVRIQ